MKKVLQIAVLSLLFLNVIFYLPSCNKDTPGSNTKQPVTLEGLVLSYNVGINIESEKAQFLEGTMEVITLPSKEVLFFLKQPNQPMNDLFLAQATQLSANLTGDLGTVKVAYLHDALAIQDGTGKIYVFSLGEGKGHEYVQKLSPSWTGKGFGLSLNTQVQESLSNYKGLSAMAELRTYTCDCKADGSSSSCDSGGTGASECSIASGGTIGGGSCSVRCNAGYYACCSK